MSDVFNFNVKCIAFFMHQSSMRDANEDILGYN